jgi:hypothetical protein
MTISTTKTTMTTTTNKVGDIYMYCVGAVNRPFPEVEAELLASGFERRSTLKVRRIGTMQIRYGRGHHENADIVEITHGWNVDNYGIGRPGKVILARVLDNHARIDGYDDTGRSI